MPEPPQQLVDLRRRSRAGLRPSSISGSAMFSSAVSVGIRLNDWNTSPICRRRKSVRSRSFSVAEVRAVDEHAPASGVARPAIRCSSVLLPDPLAPMTARNCPAATSSEIPASASTVCLPLAEVLRDVFDDQWRHRSSCGDP